MTEYLVAWRIDLDVDSPQEAALNALAVQRDSQSSATVFDVTDERGATVTVDLADLDDGVSS